MSFGMHDLDSHQDQGQGDSHRGPVDSVDRALGDLALEAVQTLRIQMLSAKQAKDKIAAANSILDRLGYGRATRAQAEVADKDIRNALEAAAKSLEEDKRPAVERRPSGELSE